MLEFKQYYYDKTRVNLSYVELCKALTHLKKLEEYSWLREVRFYTQAN